MDTELNDTEARALGCLIEKEMTTPEYYPLSLNALTNACNQKSNRNPVMSLDEESAQRALDSLRFKQLTVVAADGGRVAKYRHLLAEKLGLLPPELALMCELLLRGPQTVGELRTRAERMHPFVSLAEVESVLQELMERPEPLITRLARQPGHKEARFAHLFSGEPVSSGQCYADTEAPATPSERDRLERLEEQVTDLSRELTELRQTIEEFRRQFE